MTTAASRTSASASRIANEYAIRKLARSMAPSEAFQIFGLRPGASDRDIKSRYRELARENHPDKGGDLVKMQEINAAHDVLTGQVGTGRSPSPSRSQRYRSPRDPQPGSLSASDLSRWAQRVADAGYRQVLIREDKQYVPFGDWTPGEGSTYPWGGKIKTYRLPVDFGPDVIQQALQALGMTTRNLVDLKMSKGAYGAWAIWETSRGWWQAVSFEKVKAPRKKKPGVGMKPFAIDSFLRAGGLMPVGGGTKYTYWGVPSQRNQKDGVFLRSSAKTLRVVERYREGRKRIDMPLGREVYFGQVTEDTLTKFIRYIQSKN